MYYAVEADGEHIETVEADGPAEAVAAVEGGETAREATKAETFRYLHGEIGLSYSEMAEELDTSPAHIGHRIRGDVDVRRLEVLALERLRQIRESEENA